VAKTGNQPKLMLKIARSIAVAEIANVALGILGAKNNV